MKILPVLLLFCNVSFGQLLREDNMESTSTWTRTISSGTNSSLIGGQSGFQDSPSSVNLFASSDTAYRLIGTGAGNSTIESDTLFLQTVSVNSTSTHTIRFRLASIAINPLSNPAAGVDQTDNIKVEWSPNGGLSWWREVIITGISNASWGFGTTGQTLTKNSIFPSVSTTTQISSSTTPITEVIINLPSGISSIRLRIISEVNATGETFLLDDIRLIRNTILPVTLKSFEGTVIGSRISLHWETLLEENSSFFMIYRSSNGHVWEPLENIQAISPTGAKYTYIDKNSFPGTNYYILTQTDMNGKIEKFPPIQINRRFTYEETLPMIFNYNLLGQKIK